MANKFYESAEQHFTYSQHQNMVSNVLRENFMLFTYYTKINILKSSIWGRKDLYIFIDKKICGTKIETNYRFCLADLSSKAPGLCISVTNFLFLSLFRTHGGNYFFLLVVVMFYILLCFLFCYKTEQSFITFKFLAKWIFCFL